MPAGTRERLEVAGRRSDDCRSQAGLELQLPGERRDGLHRGIIGASSAARQTARQAAQELVQRPGDDREHHERRDRDEIDDEHDRDREQDREQCDERDDDDQQDAIGRRLRPRVRSRRPLDALGGTDDAPIARSRASRFVSGGASDVARPESDSCGRRSAADPPLLPPTTSSSSSQAVPGTLRPSPPSTVSARARPSGSRVSSTAVASAR